MTEALVAAESEAAALDIPSHLRPRSRWSAAGFGAMRGAALGGLGVALVLGLEATVFLAVWTLLLLGWFLVRRRRLIGMLRRFEDATHLLLAGELERATAELDALCREARWTPAYHALFVFFRGVAELDAGRYRYALTMLQSVRDSGWFGRRGSLGGYVGALHGNIAVAHALLEEHELAALSLEAAHRDLPAARRGTLLLADLLVLARAARHREALMRVDADLELAERLLPVRRIRIVRVLQAFCETAAGGEYRSAAVSPPAAEAVGDRTVRAALDRYAARWPELRAFLASMAVA